MSSAPRSALLATRSTDKANEVRRILAPFVPLELHSLADLGIEPTPVEDDLERFDTFRENAIAKATYFAALAGLPVLTDDSGISIDALGGRPGVHSRRFAQRPGLTGLDLDRANNDLLLQKLASTPPHRRTAHYTCAAVLLSPGRPPLSTVASVQGTITFTPQGSGGFGYDPLFFFPPLGCTFAQLDSASKDRHSHRGRAIRALAAVSSLPFQG